MKLKYKVENNAYYNVKEVLKVHFEISERLLIKLKRNNQIYLNNNPTYINQELNIGDLIEVDLDFEEKSHNIIPVKMDLDILFEDEYLLIINKSANLPIHPSILHFDDSLSNGIQFYFNSKNINKKIRPVNRLDKDTSGIVIFAKNEYIQELLIKQMKNKIFEKNYYAILEGHISTNKQTIIAPIARKENSIIEREVNPNGDYSITHLEVINNFEIFESNSKKQLSFVKLILETGRTHQIRVHTKHIGHPILGDSLYGSCSPLILRQALHAYKVTFVHPISKEIMTLECELPDDMKNILNIGEAFI